MARQQRLAWMFETDLRFLDDLKHRLDPLLATKWVQIDSDHDIDLLANRLTDYAKITIYDYVTAYGLQVLVEADDVAELAREVEVAKLRVVSEILPAVGARAIRETEPKE